MKLNKKQKQALLDYRFHASSVGHLLTEPRLKADKEAGNLSETAKIHCKDIFVSVLFGRNKDISNKYTEKGNSNEQIGFEKVQKHYKINYISDNKKFLTNDYICGTPDIILPKKVIDIKCSWDIYTFARADGKNKLYEAQLQSYMWLTGIKNAELAYVLTDTPQFIVNNETYRRQYNFEACEQDEEYEKWKENFEKLARYDDIPEKLKIKIFKFKYDEGYIGYMKNKISKAREYLLELSL